MFKRNNNVIATKIDTDTLKTSSDLRDNLPNQSFFSPKGTLSTNNKENRLGKKMLKEGYRLFNYVSNEETQSNDILGLAEYEELCGIVDALYQFKNKKFYNELAMAISGLQMRVEAAEECAYQI